jgi:hypothetical protein
LFEVVDQIVDVFDADRQAHHAARDAGVFELRVGKTVLRGQYRQTGKAVDAAGTL